MQNTTYGNVGGYYQKQRQRSKYSHINSWLQQSIWHHTTFTVVKEAGVIWSKGYNWRLDWSMANWSSTASNVRCRNARMAFITTSTTLTYGCLLMTANCTENSAVTRRYWSRIQTKLQRNLTMLQDWSQTWQMQFSVQKCYTHSVTKSDH